MPNRIAKFRSALLASLLLAGTALAVASNTPARAADNCLRTPRDETPAGRHWYYRIDHATQRHCWYLGEEKDRLARSAAQDSPSSTDTDTPPKAKAAQRSVADARAELQWPATRIEQQTDIAGSQPAVANVPNMAENGNNQQAGTADADRRTSVVAARWPEASDATPVANPARAPSANPAPATVASTAAPSNPTVAASSNASVPPPPTAPVVTLAAADATIRETDGVDPDALDDCSRRAVGCRRHGQRDFPDRQQAAPPPPQNLGRSTHAAWDSADAKRPSPPAYRHPRELPDPRERPDRTNARPRPRPAAGPNDRVADFYAEISRRRAPS